jgi:hypothetical protein
MISMNTIKLTNQLLIGVIIALAAVILCLIMIDTHQERRFAAEGHSYQNLTP